MVAEALSGIASLVELWKTNKQEAKSDKQKKLDAIHLVMSAVVITKAYLHDIERGIAPSREAEKDLSIKWVNASMAIIEYDRDLHEVAKIKSLGWADPNEWARAASRPWAIKLDTIIEQCQYILKNN